MEKIILGSVMTLIIAVQIIALWSEKRIKNLRLKLYKRSVFTVCLYNINLMVILLNFNEMATAVSKQLLPVIILFIFSSFYLDFYKWIGKRQNQIFSYFFVGLIPIVLFFVVAINLIRMIINHEISRPSPDVYSYSVMVVVIYQLIILINLLIENFKLYKASLTRYGQVFIGHVTINGLYIVIILGITASKLLEEYMLMSGILYTLYLGFLWTHYVKKEWLPHAVTQPLVIKEPIREPVEGAKFNKDRRALDALTGVFTRTYFFTYLENLEINDDALAVVIMDVSGLKLINESFGYYKGDNILLEMSVFLSDTFTKGTIARISGRIFAVLITGESESSIEDKIDKIKILADQRKGLKVQANFGYYIRGSKDIDPLTLYRKAEEALCFSKFDMNKLNQRKLALMLYDNFKTLLPGLTHHLKRCFDLAHSFGSYLNLESSKLEDLKNAAIIHDIALISIPEIKNCKIVFEDTHQEKRYKNHVQRGYEVAIETGMNHRVASIVLQHHERVDGQGFPNQLVGDQIHELSQVLSIIDDVDVFLLENKSVSGIEEHLEAKIEVAFSKKMVYNMIAFLKTHDFEGEKDEANKNG